MMSFRPIWALLIVASLAGCSLKTPSKSVGKSAPVEFSPITAVHVETNSHPVWGFAQKRSFLLQTCLKDAATLMARPGESVRILGEDKIAVEQKSDADGCIHWNESVEFQYLAPENYITLERTAEGTWGKSNLKISLNPWKADVQGVVDQRLSSGINPLPPRETRLALSGTEKFSARAALLSQPSNLRITAIEVQGRIESVSEKETIASLDVTMELKLLRRTRAGNLIEEAVNSGTLELTPTLSQIRAGFDGVPYGTTSPVVVNVIGGRVETSLLWHLPPRPHWDVKYDLGLKFIPQDTTGGVMPADVIFRIDNILGKTNGIPLALVDKKGVSSASTHGASSSKTAPVSAVPATVRPSGFFIKDWGVQFSGESGLDTNNWTNSIRFTSRLCLGNSLDPTQILSRELFFVGFSDDPRSVKFENAAVLTDENGCLSVTDSLKYALASPESYKLRYVVVKGAQGIFADLERSTAIYVNPWQREDRLFHWDSRRGIPPAPPTPSSTKLGMRPLSITLLHRNLEVDRYLKLTFHRTYQLVLRPHLFRAFSFDSGVKEEALRPGLRLKLRLAFASLPWNESKGATEQFLNSYETDGEINANGDLLANVTLTTDFVEQPILEGRLQAQVDLEPPGDAGAIGRGTGRFIFFPLVDRDVLEWKPDTEGALNLEARLVAYGDRQTYPFDLGTVRKPTVLWKHSAWELLKQHEVLSPRTQIIDLDAPDIEQKFPLGFTGLTAEHVSKWMLTDLEYARKELRNRFGSWYSKQRYESDGSQGAFRGQKLPLPPLPDFVRYEKDPDSFVRIGSFSVVEGFAQTADGRSLKMSAPQPGMFHRPDSYVGSYHRIEVQAGLFREETAGLREVTDGKTTGWNLELGVGGLKGIGGAFLYNAQWYQSTEKELSHDRRGLISLTDSRSFFADELKIPLDLWVRRCLYVEVKPLPRSPRTPSYLFCAKRRENQDFAWYYVTDSVRTNVSPLLEPREIQSRVVKPIRGRENFEAFRTLMQDREMQIVLKPALPDGKAVDSLIENRRELIRENVALNGDGGAFVGVSSSEGAFPPMKTSP